MVSYLKRFRAVVHPSLRNETELRAYVRRVAAICVLLAVGFDIASHSVFVTSWDMTARSLGMTIAVAAIISYPILKVVGEAHLALYRAKMAMEDLSRRDPLTGLGNRRAMVERAEALGTARILLVVADIDRFKSVNDTRGHSAGDAVIIHTARILQDELGDLGLVCRVGGEEFALVVPLMDRVELRSRLLLFSRRIGSDPTVFEGAAIPITMSVGAAEGRQDRTFTELYAAADRALYVAKASGRDTICFDGELERRLDPPLPPEEIVWSVDAAVDAGDRRPTAA
jgi:diguanylate cyclase (GGDEF)-like protein